jgi:hypothetical protein
VMHFAGSRLYAIRWRTTRRKVFDADSAQDVDGDVDGDGRRRDSINGGRDE